jgi:2-dehydropantoate 2-reductase
MDGGARMTVGIFGAGSIGVHAGGALAAAGHKPVLVGRASMGERLAGGIEVTRFDGWSKKAGPESFVFSASPDALSRCGMVLVCVKSNATREAGETLAKIIPSDATVVSLQNGVSNAVVLRAALPGRTVLGGMAGFNVAQIGESRFHCGSEGGIVLERGGEKLARLFAEAGIPAEVSGDIGAVQWGKLLLNLNNAVNALSGLPLKEQLSGRAYRRVLAALMREALMVLKAAGIRPAQVGKAPPNLVPAILGLPDWLFKRVAAGMLKIDGDARSSMAEDLDRGREPEIDWLNGEIVRLGEKTGVKTPVNDRLIALVKTRFAGNGPKRFSGKELLSAAGLT